MSLTASEISFFIICSLFSAVAAVLSIGLIASWMRSNISPLIVIFLSACFWFTFLRVGEGLPIFGDSENVPGFLESIIVMGHVLAFAWRSLRAKWKVA
ncbi:MAG: hypothetical protein WDM79_09145 [Terricaulis sp.]